MTRPPCVRLCPAYPGNPRTRIEGESPQIRKGTYGLRSIAKRCVSKDEATNVEIALNCCFIPRCPMHAIPREQRSPLLAGALPRPDSEAFLVTRDGAVATLVAADLRDAIRNGRALLARLPLRSQRTAAQKAAGEAIVHLTADAGWRFFRRHSVAMYREPTPQGTR